MNDGNLKFGEATQFRSGEEAARNGQKGGIASGKARNLKSCLMKWLEEGGYETMSAVAAEQIEKGNPKFWELVRDTVGEKPSEKVEVSKIDTDVVKEFGDFICNEDEQQTNTNSELDQV